jgi:hypothetical protein
MLAPYSTGLVLEEAEEQGEGSTAQCFRSSSIQRAAPDVRYPNLYFQLSSQPQDNLLSKGRYLNSIPYLPH